MRYIVTSFTAVFRGLKPIEFPSISYTLYGNELCPRTGKPHWHVYIDGAKNVQMVKDFLEDQTCHVERVKFPKESMEYVKKGGVWEEYGEPSKQGQRNDLRKLKAMIDGGGDMLDIAEEDFGTFIRYHKGFERYKSLLDARRRKEAPLEAPQVFVYTGPSGSGKSWRCRNDPDFIKDGYQYMAQQVGKMYFDNYNGEKVLWFDEFSGSTMPFTLFCRIADKYGVRVETKGGSVELMGIKKILISSIEPPEEWWKDSPRYQRDPNQLWRRITQVMTLTPDQEGTVTYLNPNAQ